MGELPIGERRIHVTDDIHLTKQMFSDAYIYFQNNQNYERCDLEKMYEEGGALRVKYDNSELFNKILYSVEDLILKKNDSVRNLFYDVYTFAIKYSNPDDSEEFWHDLVVDANAIAKVYENIPYINETSKQMILAIIDEIEKKYKNKLKEASA